METRKFMVWALLLLPAAAGAEMLSLSVRKANVRGAPGGVVAWEAYQFTPFRVIDRQGSWVEIEDFEGDSGWIHKSVLGKKPSVIVKTNKANLRESPSPDGKVAWVLEKGYPLRLLKKQGSWCQVTDEKDAQGWLHESTLWGSGEDDTPEGAETQVLGGGDENGGGAGPEEAAEPAAGSAAGRGNEESGDSGPEDSGDAGQ